MRAVIFYGLVCIAAAAAPLVSAEQHRAVSFAGWPEQLDGRPLTRLADAPEEARFYAEHPVRHARFTDGDSVVLMRWSDEPADGFHLAESCYRAFGFHVQRLDRSPNVHGRSESCFRAVRNRESHLVCEHIRDGLGQVFESMEAWQLARLRGISRPPYWGTSVVTVERQ